MTSTVGSRWPEEVTDPTPGGSLTELPAAPTALPAARRERLPGSERLPGERSPAAPPQSAEVGSAPNELGWLLDDILGKVPSARHAVLLSVDGLVLGCDTSMDGDAADHLAAVASGLASLARGAGRRFEVGSVRSTVVEFDEAYLLISDAGNRTCLAVMTGSDTDLGLLAYEAELMVTRVGEHLATGER